jgi:ABC-type transport system substrate-binding protein
MFMNTPKRLFRLFILLVISSFCLVTVHAQDKTKLTIGTNYIIDVLNPTTSLYGYAEKGLYYETLVEAADGSNVMPGLAESWSVSDTV